jgi:recombinational DNA repair protein (RecF pathway)
VLHLPTSHCLCCKRPPPPTHTHTHGHRFACRARAAIFKRSSDAVTNSLRLACVCTLQGEVERLQFDLQAKESQSKDSMSQLLMAGQQQQVRMSSTVNASIIGYRSWQR